MWEFIIKDNEYAYDIKSLAMAFLPDSDCCVIQDKKYDSQGGFILVCNLDGKMIWKEFLPVPYSKNQVKQVLYKHLKEYTGHDLLWGTMTGVRPTKIPLQSLMEGKKSQQIVENLVDEYGCKPEKAELAMDIAVRENKLVGNWNHDEEYSIYIGIPFCPTRCHYCSFAAYPLAQYKNRVDDYLTALGEELQYGGKAFPKRRLQTVYIGGGTPTALNELQFERLLSMVDTFLPMENVVEYTVEAGRPDSITSDKLKIMKSHGVTRISINPQTMKQETLDRMGRCHSILQVKDIFHLARQLGFDNINMDLIAGLPGESLEDFSHTLKEMQSLNPDSITIHTLVIKRASKLREEQMERGEIIDEEIRIPQMQNLGLDFARQNDYLPYYMYRQKNKAGVTKNTNQENVGYAREGKECIYNVLIMEELQTILALGAGGSSKYVIPGQHRMERVENVKSVEDYISRIDEMIQRKKDFMYKERL